jgi:hypothetical protein
MLNYYNLTRVKTLESEFVAPGLQKSGTDTRSLKYEKLLFVIFLFYGTGINSYNTDDLSLIIMSGLGLGFFLLFKRDKIDAIFWKVLVYWLVVNFFSWLSSGVRGSVLRH